MPDEVKGQPIRVEGARDAGRLERLEDRLRVVGPRRFPALETVLAAWLALVLLLGILADRRGVRSGLRIGALAMLWLPALAAGHRRGRSPRGPSSWPCSPAAGCCSAR